MRSQKTKLSRFFGITILFTAATLSVFTTRLTPLMAQTAEETTHEYILHSDTIDQDFTISVVLPTSYSDSKQYPVVYFTDSNQKYAAEKEDQIKTDVMKDIVQGLHTKNSIPELVLVGIGYPINRKSTLYTLRDRDLTPSRSGNASRGSSLPPGDELGGAGDFASFIEDELKSFLYTRYSLDRRNETYMGHSYGGLFGFYALFNKTEMFENYVLSSASIGYGSQLLDERLITFAFEEDYALQESDMKKHVYISIGKDEQPNTIYEIRRMYNKLTARNYPGLSIRHKEYEGKNHHSVVIPAYTEALKFLFED